SPENLVDILKRAIVDRERGFGNLKIKIEDDTFNYLANMSNGDARVALNALEFAVKATTTDKSSTFQRGIKPHEKDLLKSQQVDSMKVLDKNGIIDLNKDIIKESLQKSSYLYDKKGEAHYNIISALHKSLRGSDADASLYWLGRMLEAGEDPLYVARRLVRFACEDVGLANSRALEQAVAGYQACHFIGLPECNVILAQVVVYLAKCQKSNELYEAYNKVQREVRETMDEPVPLHLRNAPTKLMKDLGYGRDYKYSPEYDYEE
ncbi:hypothetical protein HZA71_02755, partial [Candidatus Falkowbacteria bacterium]|nr:hypothetical protein [Candidatus Falkowbacteria bacterium]